MIFLFSAHIFYFKYKIADRLSRMRTGTTFLPMQSRLCPASIQRTMIQKPPSHNHYARPGHNKNKKTDVYRVTTSLHRPLTKPASASTNILCRCNRRNLSCPNRNGSDTLLGSHLQQTRLFIPLTIRNVLWIGSLCLLSSSSLSLLMRVAYHK